MRRGKHAKKRKINFRILFIIIFIFLLMISIVNIVEIFLNSKQEQKEANELLNSVQIDTSSLEQGKETERMLQVKGLKEQYQDVVGWIELEGTNINYPVMQGTDNSYYMTHDYKKEYTSNGSIFLDKDYDWTILSSNLLLYGHNNKNDCMFAQLLKYKDESFYKEYPTIRFTTAEEDAEYDIIAVFLSRVYYKSEKNVFRYYYFINAENEQEYNDYVNNAKKASLYDTGKTAEYGDQLITLSTCEYSQEDGRFVVVGRKQTENK